MTDNYSTLKDYALKDMKATNGRLHNFIANLNMKPSRNCQRSCLCGYTLGTGQGRKLKDLKQIQL